MIRRHVGMTLCALLLLAGGSSSQQQPTTLPVAYYAQEGQNWCWAAAAQMLMGGSPTQCEQANKRFNRGDCCPSTPNSAPNRKVPPPPDCDQGGEPPFNLFGRHASTSKTLSAAAVQHEVEQLKRPFMFRWDYGARRDRAHFFIAFGTTYVDNQLCLLVWDPHPGADMIGPIIEYNAFLSGGGYVLGEVLYELQ